MAEFSFGKPEPVKEMPSTGAGRKSENPATPLVKAAVGKGPQRVKVGADNIVKARGQLNRAATSLGVTVKTRAPKTEPDYLYYTVTADQATPAPAPQA